MNWRYNKLANPMFRKKFCGVGESLTMEEN